ncbi:hypothetical protein ILUMI_04932 [Ignelater luminosus]|uniref:Uncharacterized protein n=1 Tax=Ignelater luminosus TaxID=2038154 RepID=A0A8K0D816_IGNLU|nr:hypothetical protein ILUMI_04932 [Ignelater luminosus]
MKIAVLLFVAVQLIKAETTRSIFNLLELEPCHKNDPNYNDCFLKFIDKGLSLLSKGVPKLFIPPMNSYTVPVLASNVTLENIATGRAVLKDIKISNILKLKVIDVKVDVDNLSGEIDVFHPKLTIAFEYDIDGKLLESPIHIQGLFKGKFTDINSNLKIKFKVVERNGEKYFAFDDFKFKMEVGGGTVHLDPTNPEERIITDFAQNLFNQNAEEYLKLLNPIYVEHGGRLIKSMAEALLNLIPANQILPE